MEEKKKNKEIITVGLVLLLVVMIVGVSYAAFTFSKTGVTENAITTSAVTMIYTEGDNQITINNAIPITEEVGKTLSDENYVFDFTIDIKTGPKMPISYEVTAVKDASSTMGNEDVRLYLQKSLDGTNYADEVLEPSPYTPLDVDDEFGAKAGEMVMDVGTVSEKVTYYYRLRMWVDSSYELSSEAKSFTVKVNAYGKEGGYTSSGAPNPPELVGDMIPVIYDDANNTWVKSSTSKGKWYNYDKQMWANAITIKDSTIRETYKNAAVGTPINIEDINTFMVWIPRYSYTLGNTYGYQIEGAETPTRETPGAFDIKFVDKNTIDMGSGQYTGDTPDNYFTSSSFCWGDTCDDEATRKDPENIELSGIWVAKFEITGTTNDISSIPSVTSINGKVSDLFTSIQNGINGENGLTFYGLSGNYDTHMIKNTEWGAMTILSQSRYGKYGNSKYNGIEKKVVYNNCIDGITGIGADTVSASSETCKTNTYETQKGQAASTTGNIYGLYDTSGGREDHVMGNYEHYSGRKDSYNSGFSGLNADGSTTTGVAFPSRRYYNLYKDKGYIKGDAILYFYTGSMTPPSFSNPWAARGGNAYRTSVLSPFEIVSAAGFSGSTRFVLIPTK